MILSNKQVPVILFSSLHRFSKVIIMFKVWPVFKTIACNKGLIGTTLSSKDGRDALKLYNSKTTLWFSFLWMSVTKHYKCPRSPSADVAQTVSDAFCAWNTWGKKEHGNTGYVAICHTITLFLWPGVESNVCWNSHGCNLTLMSF